MVNIDDLPAELLVETVHYLKAACWLSFYLGHDAPLHPSIPISLRWIAVSQVSRRWRNILLKSPVLWEYIDLITKPALAAEVLERSGFVPLTLLAYDKIPVAERREELWPLFRPHMLRLQHINIYRATSVDIDALDYSACSLPLLHTFYVEHEGEEVPSLCSFLKQDFPRLQSLRVVHCNIPRRVYSFPRLVSLTLDGSIDRLPVLTISDILATIEATPKLEYIHLSYVVMPLSHVDAENLTAFQRDPIEAPSLLFFKTTSSHFDATYCISTIKRHSQSQFPRYELKSTATPVKTITQAQILNVSEFCAQSPPSSLTVDLFPNQLGVLVDDAVYMEFPSSCSHRSVNATHRLLSAISPDEIKSLVFTDNTSGIYADFLHLWPNIETLDISTDETYLTQVWEKLKGHNHLEGITIFGMDLEVVVNNDPSPLVEFLRSRAESGVPIKKLRLSAHERRHPKAEMVEKLKQFTDVDVVI